MTPAVLNFQMQAGKKLGQIAKLLASGAKLTLVVRFEDKPEQDIILTDDTTDGAIAALERRRPVKPMKIEEGATYRTQEAVWTVRHIGQSGMVYVRRDDGRTARFGLRCFASRVVERIN